MAKLSISRCPFCGWKPGGKPNEFASTQNGPAVVCLGCGAGGPAALGMEAEQEGPNDARMYPMAVVKWNKRTSVKMLADAAKLIGKLAVVTKRTASFSSLHAELKHWLEFHRDNGG